MYDDILVTVITCVYNTPLEYLKEAVGSILNQTHTNFEYYIVDDCSKDDLYKDAVFSDKRIKIIRLKENSGPAVARNTAISLAKGKYIAIMDSDDISMPDRFKEQIAFLEENPDTVALGTFFTQFGDKTNTVKRCIDDNDYYRCCLLFSNAPTILNPSVMLRGSTLRDNNILYDPRLKKGEDYKMWVELSRLGRCTNLKKDLFRYRVHNNQTSKILSTKDISPYDFSVIKEQYEQMGLLLTKEEEALMQKNFRSKEVPALAYKKVLDKIITANEKTAFFDKEKLERRVNEQWRQKIYNTKPLELLKLLVKLPLSEGIKIIGMQLKRVTARLKLKVLTTFTCLPSLLTNTENQFTE